MLGTRFSHRTLLWSLPLNRGLRAHFLHTNSLIHFNGTLASGIFGFNPTASLLLRSVSLLSWQCLISFVKLPMKLCIITTRQPGVHCIMLLWKAWRSWQASGPHCGSSSLGAGPSILRIFLPFSQATLTRWWISSAERAFPNDRFGVGSGCYPGLPMVLGASVLKTITTDPPHFEH